MHWQRGVTLAALLLAWALLAVWQWQEYNVESEAARESVCRQADSVMNVLVGGVQSHRRLERFLEQPIQGMLDALGKSQDILAVAVVSSDRQFSLTAGDTALLNLSEPIQPGQYWNEAGYRYVVAFQVSSERLGGPGGMGPGGPSELGPGVMGFGGMGRRDMRPNNVESGDAGPGPNDPNWRLGPPGGGPGPQATRFFAVLVLSRTRLDQQISQYLWLRISVVVAGGLVIFSIAIAWRAAVRLAEAHGHAQLLETEARHLRDLSQAAAGLAHETRSPLGLIRGWTQRWIQGMPDGHAQRGQAQAVIEECDRVTARINQFLAFARPCEPRIMEFRPAEIFGELAMLLEPDLDAKRLALVPAVPSPDTMIRADREMFRQALFNLIQNAVEFSPEGATVEVSAIAGQDGATRIEVADRGPGISADEVSLLFTPYHTTRSSGTGLGLAIVRRIATAHGWQTGFTSRPGGGSIFWIDGIQ